MKGLIQFIEKKLSLVILLGTSLFFANNSTGQVVVPNPTSPWIVPAGVTQIKVEVWGSGGGGGTAFDGNGGGGGGGAYNTAVINVSAGQQYTITKGAGGASGANGNPSTVSGTGGTVTANGGSSGGAGFFSNGGSGGGGTGGAFAGGAGGASSGNGAGGGGGAGNNGVGLPGGNAAAGAGGPGNPNNAPYIGGTGGTFITATGTGSTGTAPGGGGGGGKNTGFATSNGGVGGAGQVVITYTVCPAINTTAGYNSPVCLGSAINLTATNASGGTSPYTYGWSGPLSYTSTSQNPTIANSTIAMAGTYTVTAKDNNGCTGSSNVTVTINPLPVSAVTAQTNISCNGANDGTITVGASGGTGPYTFSVDGTNFFAETSPNTRLFTGLAPNNPYTIKVKDSNQCISK